MNKTLRKWTAADIRTIQDVQQAARDYLNHFGSTREEKMEMQQILTLAEQGDRRSHSHIILRLQHYFEEVLRRPVKEEILPHVNAYEGLAFSTYGWGILDAVLHLSPWVEEVRLSAGRQVAYIEQGVKKFLDYIPSWQEVETLQQKLTNTAGLSFNEKKPRLSSYLESLKARLTMFTYPYSRVPVIIVRRFATPSFSLDTLREQEMPTFDEKVQLLIEQQVHGRGNALVIGPMAAGKTTLMLCMLKLKDPQTEYITIFESEHEMRFGDVWDGEVIELQNVEEIGIELGNSFKDMYRSTANTILIGEIREPIEAYHFINAGVRGTDATLAAMHERFPHKALNDLTDLVYQYGGRSIELTQERISRAVNFINSLTYRNNGHRFIDAIHVTEWNDVMSRVESVPLVSRNRVTGEYEWTGKKLDGHLVEYMCHVGRADLAILKDLRLTDAGRLL
ncbi:Flp pilus assembly complex ATPase component TadA [Brevibacillus composti]|uniref:Flp pilus assembly complex ATPase component TadA n=1 Tax=Brevibacillus composti TaxID=2796470 RepID=A0A7T5EL70_9BACL|nr:ATPase, T2SS/T4P/T4SS family [Brevibacillus composti]QQE74613.1 Flp pilus assembly complex ATPase component TadA [Brevibacillus composti]QUO41696.1 Flp pilus assembly complex ATPase component TadA [Brevibacillus composti]